MRVVLATDRRKRVILDESAKSLRLQENVKTRLSAKLQTIAGATHQENIESTRITDLVKGQLSEIKVSGVGTEYRAACLVVQLDGAPTLVVGRLLAREDLNNPKKKKATCKAARKELDDFIAREK